MRYRRGAGGLSRPGLRLRDSQPDAAGDPPSAQGAARDAAGGPAGDRGVSEFRPLADADVDAVQRRRNAHAAVSIRVVRIPEHSHSDGARFRSAGRAGIAGGGAALLPGGPPQSGMAAQSHGGSRGIPGQAGIVRTRTQGTQGPVVFGGIALYTSCRNGWQPNCSSAVITGLFNGFLWDLEEMCVVSHFPLQESVDEPIKEKVA